MACQSSRAPENLNNGFTPLVERLQSFSNIADASYVSKMKDYIQGNMGSYENTLHDIHNDKNDINNENDIEDSAKNAINGSDEQCMVEPGDSNDNSASNLSNHDHNESDHDDLCIDENKSMETDNENSDVKESENIEKVENSGDACDNVDDNDDEDVNDAMSDSYTDAVNYTKDVDPVTPISENCNDSEMPLETVVDNEDLDNDDDDDKEFTGLQNDNGIYTGSHSNSKSINTVSRSPQTNSQITTVSECDSTSVGSDFIVERSLAAEIANSIQLGDVMCQPQDDKSEEELNTSTSSETEPRKERWTMKIKVGSTSDGSRCEIIKQIDYEDAKKSGLIKDDPALLSEHPSMHNFPPFPPYDPVTSNNDIKSVVGKRKKEKKIWRDDEITTLTMTDLSTPPKKVKGGLRSDCPPFCKANCTKVHHPLLVTARRMIENDSNTTIMFLEEVSRYYGGDLGQMTPATEIHDPWKDTNFPLLHYLALMGKCSGCFALVDAGQSCLQAISSIGDTVLHTLIREMYNFNCTHGHMDILVKKFTILLKEFSACLLIENYMKETPFHLLGKLISGTSQLLNVPGKYKLPYRLYQFGKNMLLACLEQYKNDGLDREVLNRQDTLGNTISHYIAQDRASHNLLEKLLEKGANFTIINHAQQNIEDVKLMAPPPPDGEILQMAEFSAKGNKYKKAVNKKVKMTLGNLKAAASLGNFVAEQKTELTMEQAADNFMEMLNSKLSDVSEWEPIEKMQLKKKSEKKSKSAISSSSGSPPRLQHFDAAFSHAVINNESRVPHVNANSTARSDISVSSTSLVSIASTFSASSTSSSSISLPSVSSGIADITSTSASSSSIFLTDTIKVEKPDEPTYSTSNPVSDISLVDKLCNLSNSLKTTAPVVNVTTISSSQNKSLTDKLSHISIPNVRPTAMIPNVSSQTQYPVISNVQAVPRDAGMQNVFMFRPHGPPMLTQRPRMNMINQTLPSLVPRPPPALQPTVSVATSQQPLLLKTADGKLMSINVVQVSKGNTQANTTWHQTVNNIPPIINVHPQGAHSQRPQFIDPNNLRYIAPSMVSNNFRPPDPNINASSVSFTHTSGVGMPHPHPPIMPNILPQSYHGGPIPNMNSIQNPSNMFSQASLIQKLMTAQSLANCSLQNATATSKFDAKKNRGLEASIENLRHSAMNSVPSTTSKNKNSVTNKSRLAASLKNQPEDSPQVIILDEESSVKTADTRELQSPSIESSQDLDSPFRDIDGVASFMKNYLQEKGSIEDFLKFSNEKKEKLAKELEEERKRVKGINNEILVREVDIKDTRESVVGKEMEIAHLRLKLTKIQNDVNQLKNNRQTITDSCAEIEKRMKTLEDQTALFTSWSTEGRTDK